MIRNSLAIGFVARAVFFALKGPDRKAQGAALGKRGTELDAASEMIDELTDRDDLSAAESEPGESGPPRTGKG